MATRLSVISTRTGDDGTTGLGDGTRVSKHSSRIEAMGNVDELNSVIGLLRSESLTEELDQLCARIQNDLFDLGAELCIPGHSVLTEAHVAFLDERLNHYNANLGRLQEFILPGGCRSAALAHLARTVCRRTERSIVAAHADEAFNAPVMHYLNRLSDLFFVLARVLNREAGQEDILWRREPWSNAG